MQIFSEKEKIGNTEKFSDAKGLKMSNFITDIVPGFLDFGLVFPCQPLTKLPATTQGWKDASNSHDQIASWRAENLRYNWAVACGLSNLFVLDIDPQGLIAWNELTKQNAAIKDACEATFSVSSPRKGIHFYFKGECLSTSSKIAPGIDTRGGIKQKDGSVISGGYVLLPGSKLQNGAYTVRQNLPILALPDVIRNLLPERTTSTGVSSPPEHFDRAHNIRVARKILDSHIETGNVSIEGCGGNSTAYKVAASIIDHGIDVPTALELMLEKWNSHCTPPWDIAELKTIVANAARYAEHKAGQKAILKNSEVFKLTLKPQIRKTVTLLPVYAEHAEEPNWLVRNLIPSNGCGLLYGATGSYKSFIALDIAASLAHGHKGQWDIEAKQHDVLFFAGEGANAVAKKRWPAWQIARKEKATPKGFGFIDYVPPLTDLDSWRSIRDGISELKLKPKLIVIDTLARLLLGMDENSSKDATTVTSFMETLAAEFNCFVLAVHHVGKDVTKGARGSSAFLANVDAAFLVKKNEQGAELKVVKQKDADVDHSAHHFKLQKIHNSIVLDLTDEKPVEINKKARFKWATPEEILPILQKHNIAIPIEHLANMIASKYEIEEKKIIHKLENTAELQFLRSGKLWRIPNSDSMV